MNVAELLACGYSIRKIAAVTGHSKNTVKKYLRSREVPKYKTREKRPSKLDPFKPLIRHWMDKGITNCEVLLRKIREQGYAGGKSILKDYVKAFRPPRQPPAVVRYETAPGEQAQVDYGEVKYLGTDGVTYRLYCFVMVLGYSRDLYIEFSRSANIAAFLRAHVRALEYFGGVPRRILYDNAKVVRIGTRINPLILESCLKMLIKSQDCFFLRFPICECSPCLSYVKARFALLMAGLDIMTAHMLLRSSAKAY